MTLFEKLLTTKELMKELKLENLHFRAGDFVDLPWFSLARQYSFSTNKTVYFLYCQEKYRENVTCIGDFTIGTDDIYKEGNNIIIIMRKSENDNVLLLSNNCMMDKIPKGFFHQGRRQQSFKLESFNCLYKDHTLNKF